jgi:hypothetical protein
MQDHSKDKARYGISPGLSGRLSGDLPMRPDEALSLTVTLQNELRINIPDAVVRRSTGLRCAVENTVIERHTQAYLQHDVKRLGQEPTEIVL